MFLLFDIKPEESHKYKTLKRLIFVNLDKEVFTRQFIQEATKFWTNPRANVKGPTVVSSTLGAGTPHLSIPDPGEARREERAVLHVN